MSYAIGTSRGEDLAGCTSCAGGFDVERALLAMVANRALAPYSTLYCCQQWLKVGDIRIKAAEALKLQHLYQAIDFLEADKETVEKAIYFRMVDLLNPDVELVFYDTTSLQFEIDEPRPWRRRFAHEVHGSLAAGRNIYHAPRKRGHSKTNTQRLRFQLTNRHSFIGSANGRAGYDNLLISGHSRFPWPWVRWVVWWRWWP